MDELCCSSYTGGMKFARFGFLTVEEAFKALDDSSFRSRRMSINGADVIVHSRKLQTFRDDGLDCKYPGCARCGNVFAIEKHHFVPGNRYHLNLYGTSEIDPELMLFTADHKIAKALGGADQESNMQTMCFEHNNLKSKEEDLILRGLTSGPAQLSSASVL